VCAVGRYSCRLSLEHPPPHWAALTLYIVPCRVYSSWAIRTLRHRIAIAEVYVPLMQHRRRRHQQLQLERRLMAARRRSVSDDGGSGSHHKRRQHADVWRRDDADLARTSRRLRTFYGNRVTKTRAPPFDAPHTGTAAPAACCLYSGDDSIRTCATPPSGRKSCSRCRPANWMHELATGAKTTDTSVQFANVNSIPLNK